MPLLRRETPEGPVWVRPPYRPADYTVPPEALALFARWPADGRDAAAILAERGNPFANYVEVDRRVEGGRERLILLEASHEFAVEVEAGVSGFGVVLPLPPERAYDLACARDALRSKPVVRED